MYVCMDICMYAWIYVCMQVVANGLLASGSELFTKLKIAFLAADILWEFVSSSDPIIKTAVKEADLMAWVDTSIMDIVRRNPHLSRSAMQVSFAHVIGFFCPCTRSLLPLY